MKDVISVSDIENLINELQVLLKEEGLKYLINNAGYMSKGDQTKGIQHGIPPNIEQETNETFLRTYNINVVGPFMLSKKLIPLLVRGECKNGKKHFSVIFNMSSFLGSITHNTNGSYVSYRASKAALNMLSKTLAIELEAHRILVMAISPGWVKTRMGGENADLTVTQSVQGMLKVIRNVQPKDNGCHIDYSGKKTPKYLFYYFSCSQRDE
ncbi:hypothetical protein HZS_4040 [Henneguya salminicola]|nr:hypothetical protein HZS_4040 [Henneguya salminicola]